MSKVKTLVFTTQKNHEWLRDHEAEIVDTLNDVKNIQVDAFEYRYIEDVAPVTYVNKEGKVKIRQDWFDQTFTQHARAGGFNAVAFHFTRAERKAWGLHETINGTYYRDTDKVWEFWVCADENQRSTNPQIDKGIDQYVRVFIHEFGHGFMHWWQDSRRPAVHEYDYDKNDIKSLFATITAPIEVGFDGLKVDTRHSLNNFWKNNKPRSIMLHTTGGSSLLGAVETLRARGLSYNYIIDQIGTIYEIVHYSNSAWHAGVIKSPTIKAKVFYGSLKGSENPNRNSVGIAYVYPTDNRSSLSDRMIDSTVRLLKAIGSQTAIRYTADNIFAHVEVTSDKPQIVLSYKKQIIDAIVGDKNEKDLKKISRLKLMIQYLTLLIKVKLLKQKL